MVERPDTETRDKINRLFADITGTLEDAAARASDGQNPSTSLSDENEVAKDLDTALTQAQENLDAIKRLIDNSDSEDGVPGN